MHFLIGPECDSEGSKRTNFHAFHVRHPRRADLKGTAPVLSIIKFESFERTIKHLTALDNGHPHCPRAANLAICDFDLDVRCSLILGLRASCQAPQLQDCAKAIGMKSAFQASEE
jgi:hypothetical protein